MQYLRMVFLRKLVALLRELKVSDPERYFLLLQLGAVARVYNGENCIVILQRKQHLHVFRTCAQYNESLYQRCLYKLRIHKIFQVALVLHVQKHQL